MLDRQPRACVGAQSIFLEYVANQPRTVVAELVYPFDLTCALPLSAEVFDTNLADGSGTNCCVAGPVLIPLRYTLVP
jgi:hypothetical protein